MKFELKPDNRNSSDEDLIKDLIDVAKKLNVEAIGRNEYNKHGRYSESTLRNRFGGWLNTLKKAGLYPKKNYNDLYRTKDYYTDEQLIDELKRISRLSETKILSKRTFNENKKVSAKTGLIESRFGSWSKALKKAGITVAPSQSRYSSEDLFENLLDVWSHYGRQPTVIEMDKYPSKITRNTYSNHFGNWRKALEAFIGYMNNGKQEAFQEVRNGQPEPDLRSEHLKHKTSRTVNLRLRFLVMKRDDFKCQSCGGSPATDSNTVLHVDHKIAWANGGETVLENLQTLCSICNIGKSNLV